MNGADKEGEVNGIEFSQLEFVVERLFFYKLCHRSVNVLTFFLEIIYS